MPPSLEANSMASEEEPLPVCQKGGENGLSAPLPSRQRYSAYGLRHTLPVIPEELELSEATLSGAQQAMDLLSFALSDVDTDSLSGIQSSALPENARKALELLKFACATHDMDEDEDEDGKQCQPLEHSALSTLAKAPEESIRSSKAGEGNWNVGCFSMRSNKIHNAGEGKGVGSEEVVDGEKLLEVDLEGGSAYAEVQPPVVAVGAGGFSGVAAGSSERDSGKVIRALTYTIFALVNMQFLAVVVAAALLVGNFTVAVIIAIVGSAVWASLFIVNLALGAQTKLVLQRYLRQKAWTSINQERLAQLEGKTVVVKGVVSKVDDRLLSSEFQRGAGDYLVVNTSLKSVRPKGRRDFRCKEHVRQTRAMNFRVTDSATGVSVRVAAGAAAESGALVPLLDAPASLALRTTPELVQWLGDEAEVRRRIRAMENTQVTIQEGYLREGQTVTVMGSLRKSPATNEFVIKQLEHSHNVSKLMFFAKVVPFFFPVWVSGLVIFDRE